MIHYALRCAGSHEFDGWFKDSATFERMASRGLVECPHCGERKVARGLMAPAIGGRSGALVAEPAPMEQREVAVRTAAPPPDQGAMPVPAAMVALLQRMRAEVEKRCDHVGPRFAEEARKMASGESTARGIYGESTPDEADALREEGIAFETIPWLPRADG